MSLLTMLPPNTGAGVGRARMPAVVRGVPAGLVVTRGGRRNPCTQANRYSASTQNCGPRQQSSAPSALKRGAYVTGEPGASAGGGDSSGAGPGDWAKVVAWIA